MKTQKNTLSQADLYALEDHILATLKDHDYYKSNKQHIDFKGKLSSEKGLGTIEMVVILAVLVGLGLLFKTFAVGYFKTLSNTVTGADYENQMLVKPEGE